MRQLTYAVAAAFILCGFSTFFTACHDDGGIKLNTPISGDDTPDTPDDGGGDGGGGGDGDGGGGNGGGGGGGGGGNTDSRFVGTWITSFGDDLPAGNGRRQYALRIAITRNGDDLTGNGTMLRYFNNGPDAVDDPARTISATGAATGNEATLTVAGTSGTFTNNPVWYLRIADSRLVGMYAERDNSLVVQRSGHAIWHPAGSVDLNASWVAAFDDKFGTGSGFAPRDRTAVAILSLSDNTITGLGSYVEQRSNGASEPFDFNVASGTLDGTQVRFTYTGFTPDNGEVDWFGYHSGNVIVAAFGQFNSSSELARFGHATWYKAGDTTPAQFDRDWTTSFGDSAAAGNLFADYVMAMTGVSVVGNTVTGSVRVLQETDSVPSFVTYTIDNGNIVGNQMNMDIVRNGERFSWNFRLASGMLVGSYTQFNSSDEFVSRGNAEWRSGSASNLDGNYVASFTDTSTTNATENRASQFALISIDSVNADDTFSGTGSLRLGGETNRRQFALNGTISDSNHIVMTWQNGVDLFGNTVWNLRKAGNTLYGTYTNYASDNASIEFQGHATFVRASGN